MRSPTRIDPPKLRLGPAERRRLSVAALLACVSAAAGMGATATPAAARLATESLTVTGYPVSTKLVATAGAGSPVDQIPALAPAPDGTDAEWVLVSGGRQDLVSITPSGIQHIVAKAGFRADNGPPVAYASVDADGYDWILDNDQSVPEDSLYAVGGSTSASPGLNTVATFDGFGEDMTLGSDGALYISDDAGNLIRCQITPSPSAICTRFPLSANFDGGAYAVGSGGPLVWFTDAAGELGAVDGSGAITGPFADPRAQTGALSPDPETIVEAANGLVYAAGGAQSNATGNNEILDFDPSTPSVVGTVASALTNLVALTVGPDGNIWFLDAGANQGAGAVGRLTLSTGALTEYPLPAGVSLPANGARIAPGPDLPDPDGDGEVFFNATTTAAAGASGTGVAVVGEVSGIPFPTVAGSLQFQPLVTVSRRRAVVLTLACDGPSNAECSGRLGLRLALPHGAPLKSVEYDLRGGETLRSRLELSGRAFRALERRSGHRVSARVTPRAKLGTVNGRALTLVGPSSAARPRMLARWSRRS